MLKKLLILVVALQVSIVAHAQFVRGIGVFGAGNTSRHQYKNGNPQDSTHPYISYVPPSHRSAELPSWGLGIFLEMLPKKHIRWQTELEYTHKGASENALLNPYTNDHKHGSNKYTYIQWNNYLKVLLEEGYRGFWYGMIGPRLEYNMSRSISSYSPYAGNFHKLNVSPDAAVGYEFIAYSNIKFFTELHYNPDVYPEVSRDKIKVTNRTWELRVGLIYRFQKPFDDCNAPKYHGNY